MIILCLLEMPLLLDFLVNIKIVPLEEILERVLLEYLRVKLSLKRRLSLYFFLLQQQALLCEVLPGSRNKRCLEFPLCQGLEVEFFQPYMGL